MDQRPHGTDVDPDPVAIASLGVASVALVLQFVQTWKALEPPSSPPGSIAMRANNLGQLDDSVRRLQGDFRSMSRSIEFGSANADREFYEAPFRVASASLNLDRGNHTQLQHQFTTSCSNLGGVAAWINHIVREDPALAARLGGRIAGGLEHTADVVNQTIGSGGPNGTIMQEARMALESLARAIEAELRDRN